jgi:hypothetical protein
VWIFQITRELQINGALISLANFLKYKMIKYIDQQLKDTSGKLVKSVFGVPIRCDGGWSAPSNEFQLQSFVNNMHACRGTVGKLLQFTSPTGRINTWSHMIILHHSICYRHIAESFIQDSLNSH